MKMEDSQQSITNPETKKSYVEVADIDDITQPFFKKYDSVLDDDIEPSLRQLVHIHKKFLSYS